MARVTGHYDARVVIDFDFDDATPGTKQFEEIRRGVKQDLTRELQEYIESEIKGFGRVKVRQKQAELRIENKEE